ncbi:hypothetical protein PHYPO_G00168270 [Pangasianodon hypophthalmus]|uniref:Fibrinogen C-terminal domain-containing protein n=1 Tax=Pangasianodon hypophthalmus TaxID=310915 RepID=A0A5N5JHK3_PANHP|nr:hypothetical protein PHYPO_G00168270 [Pangasianodon hypophthalmus]
MANWIVLLVAFASVNLSLSVRELEYSTPQSCKDLKQTYKITQDGLYYLSTPSGVVYQTYCDMTTAGGGWTLVASVHENNMYGKCTTEDSSSSSSSPYSIPQNPGYYGIRAEDVAVWHVPNNELVGRWKLTSFLRYHTETKFLNNYGGNLYNLFKQFPVKYNVGSCPANHGPSVPVVYDVGDATSNHNLYGPHIRAYTVPGFITFRAINTENAAMAICSGSQTHRLPQ